MNPHCTPKTRLVWSTLPKKIGLDWHFQTREPHSQWHYALPEEDVERQWKNRKFDPRHPKMPKLMTTKIGMGDYVPCTKLHFDPIRGFCSPHMRICLSNVHSANFWEFKDVPFKGPESKILHFDFISPKTKIFGRLSTGLRKFRLKTGFNIGTLSVNTLKTTSYAFGSWILNRQIETQIEICG